MGAIDSESPAEPKPGTARPRRRSEWLAALAAVLAGVALIVLVPQLRHSVSLALQGDFGGLRQYIRGLGAGGLALLTGLMLGHALIFYPSEIVTATAGYVYGFLPGLLFVTGGWLISALLAYLLGRMLGRPLLHAVLGPRFARLERGIERGGIALLLSARLIPVVPFSLMGYAAGATRVRVWQFAWTTVVGFFPLTAAVAYLGSRAQSFSLNDPVVWVASILLIASLVAVRVVNLKRR
jgi:uncharacterized membrane protein YdjX (TVP38/TMEM64 family)